MKDMHLMWFVVVSISLQISTAKWCTRMGSRAYNEEVDGNRTKYITKIEKYCCDGYSLNGTECKPICKQDCSNGICENPGQCVCNQGYQLQNISQICEPFCSTGCVYGKCIKPETCECEPGYAMNSTTKMCEPICKPKCTAAHSKCLKPNHCECDAGYRNNQTTHLCEPICNEKCVNGFCSAPGICECNKGYSNNSTTSQACQANHCTKPCFLGYCDTNGECYCHPGYTKSILIMGNTHCETIVLHSVKLLCIFLSVILVFAIIVVIIVKVLVKKGTYKPKMAEDEYKQKVAKL